MWDIWHVQQITIQGAALTAMLGMVTAYLFWKRQIFVALVILAGLTMYWYFPAIFLICLFALVAGAIKDLQLRVPVFLALSVMGGLLLGAGLFHLVYLSIH